MNTTDFAKRRSLQKTTLSRYEIESALFRLAGAEIYRELNPGANDPVCEISLDEALIHRDSAIQLAIDLLGNCITRNQGLSRVLWDFIQTNRDAIKRCLEKSQNPEIVSSDAFGRLAMEASLYELAVFFEVQDPFYKNLCLLLSGQVENYLKLKANTGFELSFRDGLLATGLSVLCLRLQGNLPAAADLFDSTIIPHFFDANTMALKDELDSRINDREVGELLLIGATVHFFAANYTKAVTLYRAATELLDFANAPSRTAVAYFNSAVTCNHLAKHKEVEQFLTMARYTLKTYSVPGLEASMNLFEIECCAGNAEFTKGLTALEALFQRPDLNPTQRIVAHQTHGRILIELGRLKEADNALSVSRQLIAETGFEQFGGFQAALEMERETLGGKNPEAPRTHSRWSQRSQNLISLAEVRSFFLRGNKEKASQLYQQFLSKNSQSVKTSLFREDIESYLYAPTSIRTDRGRVLQSRFFQALEQKKLNSLKLLLVGSTTHHAAQDILSQVLGLMLQALLFLGSQDEKSTIECAEKALALAEAHDLNRLSFMVLAILASVDPHRHFLWAQALKAHDAEYISFIEKLLAPFLPKQVFSSRWMITPSGASLTYRASFESEKGLIIDKDTGHVTLNGKMISFSGQTVLFRLLCEIATASPGGLSKESAVEQSWGYTYDPLIHDALVYSAIRRLRALVPIEVFEGRYRLPQQTDWTCLVSEGEAAQKQVPLNLRQKSILELAAKSAVGRIGRQDVADHLKTSPRTALRELTVLVEMKVIERVGAGRAATYQIPKRRAL